ncbi:MAG: DNA-binding protein [Anaerolineae bacterium SG8_19]|nr:MAG: DNA-binding protein [Anaerolineae bacterium SG8_19]
MIVVDTNIIGYLFLSSDKSTLSEQALLRDSTWAAPRLWRSEMRNVLAFYIRKGLLSLTDAQQIMTEATSLMQGQEYEVTSNQVLELVDVSNCSAYDCEFVALARDLKASLVTVDRQILKDFPDTALSLDAFVGVE